MGVRMERHTRGIGWPSLPLAFSRGTLAVLCMSPREEKPTSWRGW